MVNLTVKRYHKFVGVRLKIIKTMFGGLNIE